MANEIAITTTLVCTHSGSTVSGSTTKLNTLAGSGKFANVQVIPDSYELLVFPTDLIAEGITFIYLKNLDETKSIQLACPTGADADLFGKLLAGEPCCFRTFAAAAANPNIYAKASAASANLQIVAVGT